MERVMKSDGGGQGRQMTSFEADRVGMSDLGREKGAPAQGRFIPMKIERQGGDSHGRAVAEGAFGKDGTVGLSPGLTVEDSGKRFLRATTVTASRFHRLGPVSGEVVGVQAAVFNQGFTQGDGHLSVIGPGERVFFRQDDRFPRRTVKAPTFGRCTESISKSVAKKAPDEAFFQDRERGGRWHVYLKIISAKGE